MSSRTNGSLDRVKFEYRQDDDCTTLVFHRPGSQLLNTPTSESESARKVGAKCVNGLSHTDRAVYELVVERQLVSNSDVSEYMSMSANGSRKALQRLIDTGLIERTGQGKATRYRLSD